MQRKNFNPKYIKIFKYFVQLVIVLDVRFVVLFVNDD